MTKVRQVDEVRSSPEALRMARRWQLQFHGGATMRRAPALSSPLPSWVTATACHQQGNPHASRLRLLVVTQHLDASLNIGLLKAMQPCHEQVHSLVIDAAAVECLGRTGFEAMIAAYRPTHVLLYRYWGHPLASLVDCAHQYRLPVVGFLDDNLLDLGPQQGTGSHAYFSRDDIRKPLLELLHLPDVMVASTPSLASQLSTWRKHDTVIATRLSCSLDDADLASIPEPTQGIGRRVGYMASASHLADFAHVASGVAWAMQQRPELELELFGSIGLPEELHAFKSRVVIHGKTKTYRQFLQHLREMRWDVGLAPLLESRFNSAKTPIKWLEYTLSGIPMLTTHNRCYAAQANAGACVAVRAGRFGHALLELLDSPARRNELVQHSIQLARRECHAYDHSAQWQEILERCRHART